jgi:hypothetical protein
MDQAVKLNRNWKSWGHGYQSIRLQKQGNVCSVTGLIRVVKNTIPFGHDAKKKFWHADELIQVSEAEQQLAEVTSGSTKKRAGKWGEMATIPKACRPAKTVSFTVNNHIQPAKVQIKPNGKLSFVSGGFKHGWISLAGIMYKAGKITKAKRSKKTRVDTERSGHARRYGGWKGAAKAYKQGHMCFLSGDVMSGRSWKGRILTLPAWCRPPGKLMFALNQGTKSYRIDITRHGHVRGHGVPKFLKKKLSLDTIAFSTLNGKKLRIGKGYRKPRGGMTARVRRQGSLCMLQGSVFNPRIRKGIHSTLKHANQVAKLPIWCRPKNRQVFTTAATDGKVQRIDVLSDGAVRWTAGKRGKSVNLTGIKFNVPARVVRKYSKALLATKKCA